MLEFYYSHQLNMEVKRKSLDTTNPKLSPHDIEGQRSKWLTFTYYAPLLYTFTYYVTIGKGHVEAQSKWLTYAHNACPKSQDK